MEAVATASHIEGLPPSLVAALLYTENGPEDLETGSIDKTDYFAKDFPIEKWSALDGARTLNRMAWEWFFTTDDGRDAARSFFLYAAKPYTNLSLPEQRDWAYRIQRSEKKFRKDIAQGREYEPEAYVMRTPTPTN